MSNGIETVHIEQAHILAGRQSHEELIALDRVDLHFVLSDTPTRLWVECFTPELQERLPSVHPVGNYIKLEFAGEQPSSADTFPPVARFAQHQGTTSFALLNVPLKAAQEGEIRALAQAVDYAIAETNGKYAERVGENRQAASEPIAQLARIEDSLNAGYNFIR
jgi:hypothetical protein